MIGYVTLGTNDRKRAEAFYDGLLKELGIGRLFETEQYTAYGKDMTSPGIGITIPYNGEPATVGNGQMVALKAASPEEVERVYNKAIELGAADEGKPGPRGEGGFYGAYFRDPDGNKLNIHCIVVK